MNIQEPIYCHKCKERTLNIKPQLLQTSNGLWRIAAKCEVCQTNKSKFVKAPERDQPKQVKFKDLNSKDKLKEAQELHKDTRKKFLKRSIVTLGIDDLWAADLLVLANFEKENRGYKYILTCIDTFSKYAFGEPIKRKNSAEVTNAFQKILERAAKVHHTSPNLLHTDKGLEFKNKLFKDMLEKHNIKLYHTENAEKSAIVERFNRTLNKKLKIKFETQDTYNWLDGLQSLYDEYNNKDIHRTIGMRPAEVNASNEGVVMKRFPGVRRKGDSKPEFAVGDRVRIVAGKATFQNKYKNNWTKEIFVVSKVLTTKPVTYRIKDLDGEDIIGSFYKQELQRTFF